MRYTELDELKVKVKRQSLCLARAEEVRLRRWTTQSLKHQNHVECIRQNCHVKLFFAERETQIISSHASEKHGYGINATQPIDGTIPTITRAF